jgi:hypothetical protein
VEKYLVKIIIKQIVLRNVYIIAVDDKTNSKNHYNYNNKNGIRYDYEIDEHDKNDLLIDQRFFTFLTSRPS